MINPKTLQWSRPREWCIPLDKTAITNGRYSSALLFSRPQRISPCDHNPFTPSTMKQLDHEWTQMDADTRLMSMERKLEITLVKLCLCDYFTLFLPLFPSCWWPWVVVWSQCLCAFIAALSLRIWWVSWRQHQWFWILKKMAKILFIRFSSCKESANRAAECTQWRIPLWMWSLVAKASIRVLCFWHSRAIFLLITSYTDLQSMAMHVEVKFTLSHRADFHTATVDDCTTVDLQATSSRIKVKQCFSGEPQHQPSVIKMTNVALYLLLEISTSGIPNRAPGNMKIYKMSMMSRGWWDR